MKKKVCKHCRKEVSGDHQCHFTGGTVYYDSTSDFLSLLVIGNVIDHFGDRQSDSGHDTSPDSGGSDSGSSDSGGGCDSGGGGD